MRRHAHQLVFVALLTLMASLAYGINYQYYSVIEETVFGDRIKFWHEDTLNGPIRSNDTISIMEAPVFYDFVISSAPLFWQGTGYNPHFNFDVAPLFEAPEFLLPEQAGLIRQRAMEQNFYFDFGDSMDAWARIRHDTLRLWWTEQGAPFDTLDYSDMLLPDSATVFFAASLRLSGIVSTVLTIGASGRIGLEDNVVYASSVLPEGHPVAGHPEKFALISENEIKVLNTPANGRNNSNGMGFNQTDPDLTDIALNGIYVALNGSFTFDQQNDPDSGYVCTCQPDDRGTVYLWGSLLQHQRGYVHRSNRQSTGYQKTYRYDNDLRFWEFGLFSDTLRENLVTPTDIDFGSVAMGDTVWDTVYVYNDFIPVWIANIASPFVTRADSQPRAFRQAIPIGFTPLFPGEQAAELSFDIPYYGESHVVTLGGNGLVNAAGDSPELPREFSLAAYPNPFNNRATLTFSLPNDGTIELKLYDVQGRHAATLASGAYSAGTHSISVNGDALASGVYVAQLSGAADVASTKLLLLK